MDNVEIQVAAKLYVLVRDQHHELKKRIRESVDDGVERARMLQEAEPDVRARFRRIATRLMQKSGVEIPHRPEVCYSNPDTVKRQRRDREHAVPLSMIHDRILGVPRRWDGGALQPQRQDEIAKFLAHHILVVGVTKEQHAHVLPGAMPEGWHWFGDPMARYRGHLDIDEDGKCEYCR
ncbi:MAG: hypothetical protein EON54_23025, partial [Alcaligenaceae bacterium]